MQNNDFFTGLKDKWNEDREALQTIRAEIDARRKKLYEDYYAIKNGLAELESEGTRPKQDRERKEARDTVDRQRAAARASDDQTRTNWSTHYAQQNQQRVQADSEYLEEYNNQLNTLEQDWASYQALVKEYYKNYVPARKDTQQKVVAEAAALDAKNQYTASSQQELEARIAQDWAFFNEVITNRENEKNQFTQALQQQRIEFDNWLAAQRLAYENDVNVYSQQYFARKRAERMADDQQTFADRQTSYALKQNIRQITNQWLNGLWTRYTRSIQPAVRLHNQQIINYVIDTLAKPKSIYADLKRLEKEIFKELSLALSDPLSEFRKKYLPDGLSTINGIWRTVLNNINSYSAVTNSLVTRMANGTEETKANAKAQYAADVETLSDDYIVRKQNINFRLNELYAQDNAQQQQYLSQIANASQSRRASRDNFYANYDQYIGLFFKTRREDRVKTLEDRKQARAAADVEINDLIRQASASKAGERDVYAQQIHTEREKIYAEYARKIAVLQGEIDRNPQVGGFIKNLQRALAFRKFKDRMLDKVANFYTNLEDAYLNRRLLPRIFIVGLGRAIFDATSWLYYTAGSSAFVLNIIDRYVFRKFSDLITQLGIGTYNLLYRSVNFMAWLCNNNLRELGLLLNKAMLPIAYAARKAYKALSLVTVLAIANFSPALVSVLANAFKVIYYPLNLAAAMVATVAVQFMPGYGIVIGFILNLAAETAFVAFAVIAAVFAIAVFPVLVAAAVLPNLLFTAVWFAALQVSRALSDVGVGVFIVAAKLSVALYRGIADTVTFSSRATLDVVVAVARVIRDIAHLSKLVLIDKIAYPIAKKVTDFLIGSGRAINDTYTNMSYGLEKSLFVGYVGLKETALRIKYSLGILANDTIYYGGIVVNTAAAYTADSVVAAVHQANVVSMPVRKAVRKSATVAAYELPQVPKYAYRAAKDYISYPIAYAYQHGVTSLGRRVVDGAVGTWRGLQDMCTAGIRSWHDVRHTASHKVVNSATSVGRGMHDGVVKAEQGAVWAAYSAYDSLQKLNPANFLERGANEYLSNLNLDQDPDSGEGVGPSSSAGQKPS